MQDANKLPLLKQALPLLVRQLGGRDRVAIVVYAGGDRVVLPPTAGNRQEEILAAIDRLQAGGSTHACGGIRIAYQLARQASWPGATTASSWPPTAISTSASPAAASCNG